VIKSGAVTRETNDVPPTNGRVAARVLRVRERRSALGSTPPPSTPTPRPAHPTCRRLELTIVDLRATTTSTVPKPSPANGQESPPASTAGWCDGGAATPRRRRTPRCARRCRTGDPSPGGVQRARGQRNRSSRQRHRRGAEHLGSRGSRPAASWPTTASLRLAVRTPAHIEPRPPLSLAASRCRRRAEPRPHRSRDCAIAAQRRAGLPRLTGTGESRTCPRRSTHRGQTAPGDHERLLWRAL
jgi:hypothetical protein